MGGCCYTPRRSQFLWWYWLLLASIVGIPMLLACLYLSRHSDADEETRRHLGRKAAAIFWIGSILIASLTVVVGYNFRHMWLASRFGQERQPMNEEELYFPILLVGYLGGLATVTAAQNGERLIGLLGVVAAYGIYFAVVFLPPSLPELFWLPAVCAGVAHFFKRFTDQSTPKTARVALVAVITGAFLFWGVMKYGRWLNFALYNSVRGKFSLARDMNVDLGAR